MSLTWEITNAPTANNWQCISLNNDGTKAVACIIGGYIYVCDDYDSMPDTWTPTSSHTGTDPGSDTWTSVAINSTGDKIIAIASGVSGKLAIGTYSGSWSWVTKTGVDVGLGGAASWSWVASAGDNGTFIVSEITVTSRKIWITTDGGDNWSMVTNSPTDNWNSVAVRYNGSDTVIIGTGILFGTVSVHWTTDSGANWNTHVILTGTGPVCVACGVDNLNNNNLYYSRDSQLYTYTGSWGTLFSAITGTFNKIATDLTGENLIGVNTASPARTYVSQSLANWVEQSGSNIDGKDITYGAVSFDGSRWGATEADTSDGNIYKSGSFVCVSGETIVVQYVNGQKIPTQIKNIKSGDSVLNANGDPVKVLFNIKGGFTRKFVRFSKDSLGKNKPDQDFFITKYHPLWLNNREVESQELINGKDVVEIELDNAITVYSLCTEDRIFVMMDNLEVCTWAEKEFLERIEKTSITFSKQ